MNSARAFKTQVALRTRAKFTKLDMFYVELNLRMNFKSLLFASRSNHWRTEDVFFHWLTFLMLTRFRLTFSSSCLLIRPISGFEGFISLQVDLFTKVSLWSLSVINASSIAVVSTRFIAVHCRFIAVVSTPFIAVHCRFIARFIAVVST